MNLSPINTSSGPQDVPREGSRYVVTTRAIEEDLRYTDEESEIVHVLPATGWCARVGGGEVPLVAWVVLDDTTTYGVAVGEMDGKVDVNENVEDREGFQGYYKKEY
jgi:hypothetical protein